MSVSKKIYLTMSLFSLLLALPIINNNASIANAQSYNKDDKSSPVRQLYPGGDWYINRDVNSQEGVRLAQQRLQAEGYYRGPIDGQLTKQTVKALKEFQDDRDLYETGRLDYATTDALGLNIYTVSYDAERVVTYDLASPEIIAYAQEYLLDREYYFGQIDGQWSQQLAKGISTFQSDMELPVTGKLDAETARSMGLRPAVVDYRPAE